uniref:DNA 3'-5' helicase n=1 Tax=Globisporangium ultimum (strain ATCC 200006 / CBS 805.95 / DAOM BR144) TaxID=431595 RepID=K3W9Q6_GLOUD
MNSSAARRFSTVNPQRIPSDAAASVDVSALDAVYRTLLDVSNPDERIQLTPAQTVAVDCATRGFSVFLHLPTGAGKSLAFQAPALVAPPGKTTLVVSPLIALMHDQVNALKRKGVSAVQVSGEDRKRQSASSASLTQLLANQRLVYTTPEFLLQNSEMQQWVRAVTEEDRIERVVLDEAHCVLEWGNTFRPSYMQLSQWRTKFFSALPITLATASVTDEEITQLADIFHVQLVTNADALSTEEDAGNTPRAAPHEQMVVIQQVTDRANLRIEVLRKRSEDDAGAATAAIIAKRVQQYPTIVYCLTRREAEDVCLSLVRLGCHAGVYHGGLPRKRREFVRKQWMGGQLSVICATSAFGMGIDRSNVRFVVHHSLPLSLTSYLQQIGRAGRDEQPAVCLLLYDESDKSRANAITSERSDLDSSISSFQVSNGSSHVDLEEMAAFCETTGCRKELLYAHFGFPFYAAECPRDCNCGQLDKEDDWREAYAAAKLLETTDSQDPLARHHSDEDDGLEVVNAKSKGQVEYFYQRVLSETKKLGLSKREALSRRVVQDILARQPPTEEEMAALRGVGAQKASRYFSIFQ